MRQYQAFADFPSAPLPDPVKIGRENSKNHWMYALFRRFLSFPAERRLSDEQILEIRPRMRQIDEYGDRVFLCVLFLAPQYSPRSSMP